MYFEYTTPTQRSTIQNLLVAQKYAQIRLEELSQHPPRSHPDSLSSSAVASACVACLGTPAVCLCIRSSPQHTPATVRRAAVTRVSFLPVLPVCGCLPPRALHDAAPPSCSKSPCDADALECRPLAVQSVRGVSPAPWKALRSVLVVIN